jgi:hypothetical protein
MMGHELHRRGSFSWFLLPIDKGLADSARQQGCSCGGRLHCANYPRAPRGGPDHLPEEYRCRFSFCCDRHGCMPLSLLEAFHRTKDPCQDWGYLLRFLSPVTVPGSPLIKMT